MTKKLIIFILLIPFFIGAEDTYILNYDDVDIKKVTQDVASFSNKTLILDPKVKGRVSIFSDTIRSMVLTAEGYVLGIDNDIEVKPFTQIEEALIREFMPGISNHIQTKIHILIDKFTNSYMHREAQNENV